MEEEEEAKGDRSKGEKNLAEATFLSFLPLLQRHEETRHRKGEKGRKTTLFFSSSSSSSSFAALFLIEIISCRYALAIGMSEESHRHCGIGFYFLSLYSKVHQLLNKGTMSCFWYAISISGQFNPLALW